MILANCSIDLLNKDAQSAIKRAESKQCKQKIQETVCLHENLYPKELKPTCDFYEKVKYLGCFKDSFENRIFKNGARLRMTNENSPQVSVRPEPLVFNIYCTTDRKSYFFETRLRHISI